MHRPAVLVLCASLACAAVPTEIRVIPGWGRWTKRLEPVFTGQYGIAGDPSVVRVGSSLRMAFGGFDPAKVPQGPATCGATSTDGLVWTELDTGDAVVRGRLIHPRTGAWEDTHETPCWLHSDDGSWRMWFIGYVDIGGWKASAPARVGYATSADGMAFTAPSNQPVVASSSALDAFSITSPSVVHDAGSYRMVYAGWGYPTPLTFSGQILAATSTDGVTWSHLADPVLHGVAMPAFCDENIAEPDLVRAPDGTWVLLFTATHGTSGHDIGLATAPSPDGPWSVCPEPVIRPTPGSFDGLMTVAPTALVEDGRLRVWYAGFDQAGTHIAIGYAETPWPLSGGGGSGGGSGGADRPAGGGSGCGSGAGIAGGLLAIGLFMRIRPSRRRS